MKASDTVMSKDQIENWLEDRLGKGNVFNRQFCKDLATKQAEISFKAGIEEVVEWVDENWLNQSNMKQWQAKLKEWGYQGIR